MKPEAAPGPSSKTLTAFDEIVGLDPLEREQRLASLGDPALRRAVEELLAADADVETKLARIDRAIGPAATGAASSHDPDSLKLVGRTVSHFRVVELLASGGMGVVYRAEDTQLQRTVALKFPLPTQHVELSARKRFLHEARVAGGLDHPNLCGIYETGETEDGQLFYAMPLYPGETLKARLARERALPIADALDIARQVSLGVGAAHRAGIVHRDLKPANVMLLPDGTVKVLDFGLAKARDLSLTAPQMVLGTVAYMAPEQIMETGVDSRTDVWALGVMLYEMLAGRRPFDGANEVTIAHAIVHADPPKLSAPRGEMTQETEPLILALLRKDPADRFQSFEAVVAALESLQSGERGRMQLPPRPGAFRRIRRRMTPRVAAVALTIVAAIALGAWMAVRPAGLTPEPRRVAVLPFTDLSDEDGRYLGAALSDAINTELGRISELAPPSYRSMLMYAGAAKPLPEAGRDLGVSAIVGGTVQRVDAGVRGEIQVLDPRSGKQLWVGRYDGATALDIQREVTQAVIEALRIRPAEAERALLTRPATTSARAYDLYLQGRYLELESLPRRASFPVLSTTPIDPIRRAQALYVQAIALDPGFARAHARLALAHISSVFTYDTSEVRREQARIEAEAALRLEPRLFEGHEALGFYWVRRGEWAKNLEEAERAVRVSPNHAERHVVLANAYRDAARWDDAIASFERSIRLDPHNSFAFHYAAASYMRRNRGDDALRALERAIVLRPDDPFLRLERGYQYLSLKGAADTLESILNGLPPDWNPGGAATYARYTALRAQRRYAEALEVLDEQRGDISQFVTVLPRPLMRAQMYHGLGGHSAARVQYEAARALLADSLAINPEDSGRRLALALAYAGLDRRQAAIREANRALEALPGERGGAAALMGLGVEVFARAGEFDRAFELLELLFTMPAAREGKIPFLRLWPGFDPLRSDPRFEQLLERFVVHP